MSIKGVPRSVSSSKHLSVASSHNSDNGIDVETVPTQYLASLRQIAESPTAHDVSMLAKRLGLVVLPEASTSARNSSIDAISPTASTPGLESGGYLAITTEEYQRLLSQPKKKRLNRLPKIWKTIQNH